MITAAFGVRLFCLFGQFQLIAVRVGVVVVVVVVAGGLVVWRDRNLEVQIVLS